MTGATARARDGPPHIAHAVRNRLIGRQEQAWLTLIPRDGATRTESRVTATRLS